jgi:hypothetical protein
MSRYIEYFGGPRYSLIEFWFGWYIRNDCGEPIIGPFETRGEAEYALQEIEGSDPDRLREDAEDRRMNERDNTNDYQY